MRVRVRKSRTRQIVGSSVLRRLALAPLAVVLALAASLPVTAAQAPVKGELTAVVKDGFARLLFHFADEVDSHVRVANNIITISFAKPVDASVVHVAASAPGYISAARRDPDGTAVRIALMRKVKVNTTPAAERLFVDLLPEGWTGLMPGLPRKVIEELARRARAAEKIMREQRILAQQSSVAPIKVRVMVQPTFTRYVFDLPELIGVSADNTKSKLTLVFDAMLRFDLADAEAMLPKVISAIDSEAEQDSVRVRFTFAGKVDVRTFREDNSYVVDVSAARQVGDSQEDSAQRHSVRSDEIASLLKRTASGGNSMSTLELPKIVPAHETPTPAKHAAVTPTTPVPITPARTAPAEAPSPPVQPVAAPKQAKAAAPAIPSTHPAKPIVQAAPAAVVTPKQAAEAPATNGGSNKVQVALKRDGDTLTMQFPFTSETPAAVFRREDALWLVFDTQAEMSIAALKADIGHGIKSVGLIRQPGAVVVRIKPERPQLVGVVSQGFRWTVTLGNEAASPTQPLQIRRNAVASSRATVAIPFDHPGAIHRFTDPDAGDTVLVVTALGPPRGIIKTHNFVEFHLPATSQGIAVLPLADDVTAALSAGTVVISRPDGLTLSAATRSNRSPTYHRPLLDTQSWGYDRHAEFGKRKFELIQAAADAPASKRLLARTDLARFYLARDMGQEAKAVLDVALADHPATADNAAALMLRAIANIAIGRGESALKDLASPFVGNQNDASLWRALAYAIVGRWSDACVGFRTSEAAISAMPLEMQRTMLKEMIRSLVEVGDITGAVTHLREFEAVGIPHELEPGMSVLSGRIAEGLGRLEDARRDYQAAANSSDRKAAAQGELREIVLQHSIGTLKREAAIAKLETLTTIWRGDETEIAALQLLARLYTEDGRYRDAFQIMRTAMRVHPNSEVTRRIQEEAAATFDNLFLAGKGDALPAIDALALFYDFRELTPIGRRGDEMIRRLADRLVSIDLLSQAAELLQYQVDHRLQGAARAQVAARLAVVYLMNRKPDRALATLRATRVSNLSDALRNQRLLLEARALSELKRHDVALEVAANLTGREVIRLRADILWAAKRYDEAAEQIELLYGNRWKDFKPLTESARTDILRAAIGYALGEDSIGLMRFREKYAGKMGDGPDRRAFDVVTAPIAPSGKEFSAIARSIATTDTLDAFLRDLRERYPETGALPPAPPPPRARARAERTASAR